MDPIDLYRIFCIISCGCLGLVIGSFLNVCIYRIPEKRTVVKGHSMCMTCGHNLGPLDLVPLFSWIFLRGRCRYCGAPIASRYAIIEGLTGFIFATLAWQRREYFYVPYYTNGFPWDTIVLVLLLAIASIAIVAMMIQKDKQKTDLRFAVAVLALAGIRLLISFLATPLFTAQLLLCLGGLLPAGLIVLLFSLLLPTEMKSMKDHFSDLRKGIIWRRYFSSQNGFLSTDFLFVALCGAVGLPAAIPIAALYVAFRVCSAFLHITRWAGIALAAGAYIGVVLLPFYVF